MKKLLKNVKIIDEKSQKFKNVHILINNNVIEKIIEKKCEDFDGFLNGFDGEIIDCKNNIVLPGLINSNSNLIKNFFENFVNCLTKIEFDEKFEKFKNSLSNEEKYEIYKYQILNLIKNGIVCFCDEDFYNLSLKKAVKETEINAVYRLGFENCFDIFDEKLPSKLLNENSDFVFAVSSVLENSEQNFADLIRLSKQFDKPIFVNGSENLFVAGSVESEFGKTATQLLEDYGVFDVNHVILNNNVLDKSDYEILSAYGSKLVFSPSFNITFGNKNANIYALDKTNLIGLSSFKNDFSLEMFLAKNIENENYDRVETFSSGKLFDFATKNNAEILGLNGFGEIKEECFANILLIENDNLFCDVNSFFKNFDVNMIHSVMINGKFVYSANHFVEINNFDHIKNSCLKIVKKFM